MERDPRKIDNIRLGLIRAEVAQSIGFSKKERKGVLNRVYPNLRKNLLNAITNDSGNTKLKLEQSKVAIQEVAGYIPSRPNLCAQYLMNNIEELMLDTARESLLVRNFPSFCFWFNLSFGFKAVLSLVPNIENALREGAQKSYDEVDDLLEEAMGIPGVSLGNSADYLNTDTNDALQLLSEDGTGMLLVRERVKQIAGEKSRFRNSLNLEGGPMVEWASAGAKLAKDMYESLYPLSS
ncbi:hypothetical protein HY404_01465 [Candidatus Microgenomates bacterium]|nr:hypothetical protein [Candidatus Microgenomates bacterium]